MTILRLDDLFNTYGDEKYAEVAVFLDLLRGLQLLHQTAHWQTKGANYYSDHLLFQRLYQGLAEEIDSVGERSVGLGSERLVDYNHSLTNMDLFLGAVADLATTEMVSPADLLVNKALRAELAFIKAGERMMNLLKDKGLLSRGLEQLLGTILDNHESNVYLLKQRVKA